MNAEAFEQWKAILTPWRAGGHLSPVQNHIVLDTNPCVQYNIYLVRDQASNEQTNVLKMLFPKSTLKIGFNAQRSCE